MAFKVLFVVVVHLMIIPSLSSEAPSSLIKIGDPVSSDEYTISFKTPNLRLPDDDIFICMSANFPRRLETSYIEDINVHLSEGITKHVVVVTCPSAGFVEPNGRPSVWDCGNSLENNRFSALTRANACDSVDFPEGVFDYQFQGGSSEEGRLRLPPGTGIPVGGRTGINAIVIAFHYLAINNASDAKTGDSRVDVRLRQTGDIKPASSLVLSAFGFLAPHSVSRISGSWELRQNISVHPIIAYHHSHGMAFIVNVLIERVNGSRELIHTRDPRLFQGMSALIPEPQPLRVGDKVVYECVFNNTSNNTIRVWKTNECDVYLFFYVSRESVPLSVLVNRSIDPLDKNCFPSLDEVTNNGVNIRAEYNGENSFHPVEESECHLPMG